MKSNKMLWPLIAVINLVAIQFATAADLDTAKIDELTGIKGKLNQQEGVYKITFPRADVPITRDGWRMPPFMGLGTWAAFAKGADSEAMMMGDTVLFEDEVNAAMSAALDNGLEVTALHNHFFFDEPKVFFMHIGGNGTVAKLASGVRKVYDRIKEIRAKDAKPKNVFGYDPLGEKNSITAAPLNEILGLEGEVKDGMAKFVIGKSSSMHGVEIRKEIGVNTWAAFAGSDDNAVIDGDFAMTEDELQPVLKSLRKAGINIVAIHNHMTHETPRIMFLHNWGRGSAKDLARAVKTALGLTANELSTEKS